MPFARGLPVDAIVCEWRACSPSCAEYSKLKLKPGGPPALRSPEHSAGLPGLSAEQMSRVQDSYRGGPHMRSLISIDFPAPEMEPESAHVVSAVSVP